MAVNYGFHNKLERLSLNTRLGWKKLVKDKHYLITQTVNYDRNKFYETGPWCRSITETVNYGRNKFYDKAPGVDRLRKL